jgi:hypothetical protein
MPSASSAATTAVTATAMIATALSTLHILGAILIFLTALILRILLARCLSILFFHRHSRAFCHYLCTVFTILCALVSMTSATTAAMATATITAALRGRLIRSLLVVLFFHSYIFLSVYILSTACQKQRGQGQAHVRIAQ